jgi:hypothetical protein
MLACYASDSSISIVKIYPNGIILECESGEVVILNADNNLLCHGSTITTGRYIWDFELQQYQELSAYCPLCGHRFVPSASIFATIDNITKKVRLRPEQSPCLKLPKEM